MLLIKNQRIFHNIPYLLHKNFPYFLRGIFCVVYSFLINLTTFSLLVFLSFGGLFPLISVYRG